MCDNDKQLFSLKIVWFACYNVDMLADAWFVRWGPSVEQDALKISSDEFKDE